MTILKLYGSKLSTCTRRVGTLLHELKIPFELIEISIAKGETQTPEHLEKQPFGQIPYIDDNGFILYESRAIYRYIAAKHPESGFIPAEPKANALFEPAAVAEGANFDSSASKAGFEKCFGMTPDQTRVDTELAALEKKLDAYEVILSKHRYVGGATLTLADLFHLPDMMTRRPNVARWYQELISRPSWLAVVDGLKPTETY
ncbi:thioredoxin-like protein [Mycena metata]|uniref:glutathione transferase n=1 Tax=Mycena metata TaxID=1033252 RepID=A0AAD7NGD8_9AGAR|nr:thioredoxin-like protein [Mycena metata]